MLSWRAEVYELRQEAIYKTNFELKVYKISLYSLLTL